MIDIFTRRRILIFIFAVLFAILSILFFTRMIPSYTRYPSSQHDDNQQTSECYLTEPVDILTLCQRCTPYERRSKVNICLQTGYKELVLCSKSNIETARSCKIPIHIKRQRFWLFESFMSVLGLFAIVNVHLRQKNLQKHMLEKIKKQIGENNE